MKKTLTILAAMVVLMAVGTVKADYSVDYTAELKGDTCIKFEDAMYLVEIIEDEEIWEEACLGEDGVPETDTFVVDVTGEVTEVTATVKAGRGKDSSASAPLLLGVPVTILDFEVTLVSDTDGTYIITVTSDEDTATAALSNITFCFGDDATVEAPEEGPVTVDRISPYDEPTEPEEVDED